MKPLSIILLLAMLAGAAGCGQKGDLYFPDQDRAAESVNRLEHYGLF